MKTLTLVITLSLGVTVLQAQSNEQGKQQLYYERFQSAENTYHQLLKQNANNSEAWYGLTKAYIMQGETKEAFDSLLLADASIKTEPYFKVAYGAVLLNQGKQQEAVQYFNEALNQTKEKDAQILAAIADAHIEAKSGDAHYAIGLLEKAVKRDKRNPQLQVLIGDAFRKIDNGSGAFKAYQTALQIDDRYAAAYHKTGEIFLTQKNAELYLEYFNKALAADPMYAPSIYKLYSHAFYHNPAQAMAYYKDYMSKSDASVQNQYDVTDLLYLNKNYNEAIQKANMLLQAEGDKLQPRLYKLLAYSHAANNDTIKALSYMQQYFAKEVDTNFIFKDYEAISNFYSALPGNDSLSSVYLEKGLAIEKDSTVLYAYYKKLADAAKAKNDYAAQARWLGKYYLGNQKATNLDLFYWGIAHYRTENYPMADSVFSMYVTKYPEQGFGYYWQAKSKALRDKNMQEGLAIPVYKKLIEVLQTDSTEKNYKKWMTEAYGYLAAYEANTEKDYPEAVDYFEKLLEIDPENEDAKKYIAILEKNIATKKVDN